MSKYIFEEVSLADFNQFSDQNPMGSFPQSAAHAQALTQASGSAHALVAKTSQTGEIVAGGIYILKPALRKFNLAICNQGPIMDFSDGNLVKNYLEFVVAFLKKKQVLYLTLTPNMEVNLRDENGQILEKLSDLGHHNIQAAGFVHQGFSNKLINGVGRWFFVKSLEGLASEDDLFKSYSVKTRNQIRKSEKLDVEVEELALDDLIFFENIMNHTANRREFSSRDPSFYRSMLKAYGDDCLVLMAYIQPQKSKKKIQIKITEFEAKKAQINQKIETSQANKKTKNQLKDIEDQLNSFKSRLEMVENLTDKGDKIYISGAMFVNFASEMTYLYSGSYADYFSFCGADAIQHHAQKLALEKGIESFNFYGTSGQYSGHADDGILKFKQGFGGGRVVEQVGNYGKIIKPIFGKIFAVKNKLLG